jgi:hypothetical protein
MFAPGQPLDLGDEGYRRRALIWYVLRTVIDRLESEDPWFGLGRKVVVEYPARSVVSTTHVALADSRISLVRGKPDDHWHPPHVLARLMMLWVRGRAAEARAPFANGFAVFASDALMHELWQRRLRRPLNRRAVAVGLDLTTLGEVESSASGTANVLRVLACGGQHGWWSHLFGTAQEYPPDRPDEDGDGEPDHPDEVGVNRRFDRRAMPPGPHQLSFWDILRTLMPTAKAGHWYGGVLGFIDRAVEVHGLGADVRVMLKRCIDPAATAEPYESLPKVEGRAATAA